ncbi:MAG: peptidylprolyl isomerase [Microscillaceae bacterium]|nr:peptidylprolyl isomerase [Microscillaceae bacterium]MDW8461348.1 peptidylprolyl isomerase [Cytophagales bacterium]
MKLFIFKHIFFVLLALISSLPLSAIAQKKEKKKNSKTDYVFTLQTDMGNMVFILYDETPKHKANFLKLVQQKFYDGLLFHRIIKDFMIQGGDPTSRNAKPEDRIGIGDIGYKIEAEFHPKLFHKKGAVAAARDNNPQKASSGCQFYIVQGRKIQDENLLTQIELQNNFKYTEEQKNIYREIGGTPHLDQNYTVFGEVIQGLDILDKIAYVPTNAFDRPQKDIKMTISLKKMSKKKITAIYGYKYE